MPDNLSILRELIIILLAALPISYFVFKLKIPLVVGFLLTGIIIGPYGIKLITNPSSIKSISEIGIILLLFTVGLEFSITHILRLKRIFLLGGGIQLILTILAVILLCLKLGYSFNIALVIGFIISLSSTAIVLKSLQDRGELHTTHGIISTSILLFQDMAVVIFMLIIPLLSQPVDFSISDILFTFGKSLVVVTVIILVTYYLIPFIFEKVAKIRSQEVFTMTAILTCLGTAYLTGQFGLSLALGAFISGLMLSRSEYSFQVVAEVVPLRDSFSGIFFISVGMLTNLKFLTEHLFLIIIVVIGIFFIKSVLTFLTIKILGYSPRHAVISAISISQVGEFSFILLNMSLQNKIFSDDVYQIILASIVLTMFFTPFLIKLAPSIGMLAQKFMGARGVELTDDAVQTCKQTNHIIIAGYGLCGQNLSRVLENTGIPFIILDLNGELVAREKQKGRQIFYGDATQSQVLEKLSIDCAKMVVIAISDPIATRHAVWLCRKLNGNITILVRTRYVLEIDELKKLGADIVIPEDYETSIEIFSQVLSEYNIPYNIIRQQVNLIRREGYGMLRGIPLSKATIENLTNIFTQTVTDSYFVDKGSPFIKKTLLETNIRSRWGVTVIAVIHDNQLITNPDHDFVIDSGDFLVLFGHHQQLESFYKEMENR